MLYGYIFRPVVDDLDVAAEEQQRRLTEFGARSGMPIDAYVMEENVSIRKPFIDRPEGAKLLHGLKEGDGIIVLKAAWVLASAREGGRLVRWLEKRGIALYCVDLQENISTPSERKLVVSEGNCVLVAKLLAALAVCESSGRGEAIRAVKMSKKHQGRYLGGPVPFGWRVDDEGFLVQHGEQQKIIDKIRSLREQQCSYRDIAALLADSMGVRLSHEGIRRILVNDIRRKKDRQPDEAHDR